MLGAAFKPNSDDIRDSPALDVAARSASRAARSPSTTRRRTTTPARPTPSSTYADSALEAAQGADVVLLLTEWQEFRDLDPEVLGAVVATRRIVDGRNALDPEAWRAAGWNYRALGRP